ncbi:GNAT family N-acetyltransferase [Paenibacillus dauci]|uniref:GNAT family N-acetyltransferase n=1 Tax=Paenibacillus dauci TaxID=1567106 RepID=UPI0006191D94|nr:GNAT family N-acetyltransferase [Paenibacillus dauci]
MAMLSKEELKKGIPELDTDRLILRRLTADDIERWWEYASDPQVITYLYGSPQIKEYQALQPDRLGRRVEEAFRSMTSIHFAVTSKEDGTMYGVCSFQRWDEHAARAEIGFALSQPFWGKGYATEAVGRLVTFGFEEMGLSHIVGRCHVKNQLSIRVLEKNGMRQQPPANPGIKSYWQEMGIIVYSVANSEFMLRKERAAMHSQVRDDLGGSVSS